MAKQAVKKGSGIKKTGLSAFKEKKGLNYNEGDAVTTSASNADKPMRWLIMPEAFSNVLKINIPLNYFSLLVGHSNTGKSTILNHVIVAAQKQGLTPVIFDTENNFDFTYAMDMGMEATPIYGDVEVETIDPETGEVNITKRHEIVSYDGNFLYFNNAILAETYGKNDYSTGKESQKGRKVAVIEDIAFCMNELLTAQDEGELDTGLVFVWDSVGSINCWKSYKSSTNNAMWDAAALSVAFNGIINDRLPRSRTVSSKYDNAFIACNQVWLDSMKNPMPGAPPALALKGGASFYYGARLILLCGAQLSASVKKLVATSKGLNYNYALQTKLKVLKNQLPSPYTVTYEGEVICTPHGLISTDKEELEAYKRKHVTEILKRLNESSENGVKVSESDEIQYIEEDLEG